jgi:flavin reductase (DIM6/NTAB) family NADH-FMN oxidoreductase RutF
LSTPAPATPDPATPDPEGLEDRLRRRVLWSIPTGLFVLGSRHGDARNLMTANLVVQVATDPKLVGVSVESESHTRGLVERSGAFSVSLLRPEDKAVVRRFVKPVDAADIAVVGADSVTIRTEAVIESLTGAPILARAVAWLDCEVRQRLELGSHVLFVGEVVAVGGPEEGIPDVLAMSDTRMNYGG